MHALSGVILSALVISVQLSEATNNSMDLRCNLGSHQQLCDLDLINSDLHQLNDIARETENCIYTRSGTVSPQDPRHLVNDVMCLVKNISYNIQCNKSIANNCSNVEKLFCNEILETVFEENKETFQQFECTTCIVANSLDLLNSTVSISNHRNDGKILEAKEKFLTLLFLVRSKIDERETNYFILPWIESFVNYEDWKTCLNVHMDRIEIKIDQLQQNEYKNERYIQAEQDIILAALLIVICSFLGNSVLLSIFVNIDEYLTEPRLTIFSLSLSHVLAFVFGSFIFLLPSIWDSYYQHNSSRNALVFASSVIILLCVYLATVISVEVCFSDVPEEQKRFKFSPQLGICTVLFAYLLARLATLPFSALFVDDSHRYIRVQCLYNYLAYTFIPIIIVGVNYVRNSPRKDSGISVKNEQNFFLKSLKAVIGLVIVFSTNFFPIFIVDIFGPGNLRSIPYNIAFSATLILVVVNSLLNPITMYVINRNFRLNFNRIFSPNFIHKDCTPLIAHDKNCDSNDSPLLP